MGACLLFGQVGLGLPRGSRAAVTAFLLAHRQAPALEPFPSAAAAQKERRSGAVLQRPDHRTGEEVRDSEIPLPTREEASGQDAATQRETGQLTGSLGPSGLLETTGTLGMFRPSPTAGRLLTVAPASPFSLPPQVPPDLGLSINLLSFL